MEGEKEEWWQGTEATESVKVGLKLSLNVVIRTVITSDKGQTAENGMSWLTRVEGSLFSNLVFICSKMAS